MRAQFFEITPCPQGRLATMPRPRGDDWLADEIESLKVEGVTDLVSLLMRDEEIELGLALEGDCCASSGIRFHSYPIVDRGLPNDPEFLNWIARLSLALKSGGFVAVHCRAGIGRSSVVAAALLHQVGVSGAEALQRISSARGFPVPDTQEQRAFILNMDRSPGDRRS